MNTSALIEQYLAGTAQLRKAVVGMSRPQMAARAVAGKWSTLEVICHIADFEPVYADRMKRVIAEEKPPAAVRRPDKFQAKLAYANRDAEEELKPDSLRPFTNGANPEDGWPKRISPALASTAPMARFPWRSCSNGSPTTSRIM